MSIIVEHATDLLGEQAEFLEGLTKGVLIGRISVNHDFPHRKIHLFAKSTAAPGREVLLLEVGIWGPRLDCMITINKTRRVIDVGQLEADPTRLKEGVKFALNDADLLKVVAGFVAVEQERRTQCR